MKHSTYSKVLSSLMLCATMLLLIAQTSCVKDLYQEEEKETPPVPPEEKPADSDFDFSPVDKCRLSINYDLKGQAIPFQVYYENPILDEDNNTLNEALKPNFAGWTNENGVYSEVFSIPTAIKTVYITTRAIGVPGCVSVNVENNQVNLDLSSPKTKAGLREANTRKITPDMYVLGNWDEIGKVDYLLDRADVPASLLNDINATLPSSKNLYETHPELLDPSKIQAIRIKEEAEVNLLFITESATMANVLGYYHYPTGRKPTAVNQTQRIIAFPCANFPKKALGWGSLACGDQIRLKYWDGQQFNDKFPANTTIEFFLMPNSFKTKPGYQELAGDIKESATKEFGVLTKYTDTNLNSDKRKASIALYDSNRKLAALGFEDQVYGKSDLDFNDAVFTLQTTPSSALDGDDMPPLTPGEGLPEENPYGQEGTLAFEDLWPSQGDYDMNDVVVHYKSTVYITKNNNVSKLDDEIAVKWNGGTYLNGFGYQLGVPSSVIKSCTITTDANTTSPGLEGGQNLATIILFNNVRNVVGSTFHVVTEFTTPQPQAAIEPPYNPFIIPQLGNGTREKEVHLTNKKPTSLADLSILGTYNDISDISLNKYYISKDNFPFAIYIPGEFRIPMERVRIDTAYPEFAEWVQSKGTTNTEWYLNPDLKNVYPVKEK